MSNIVFDLLSIRPGCSHNMPSWLWQCNCWGLDTILYVANRKLPCCQTQKLTNPDPSRQKGGCPGYSPAQVAEALHKGQTPTALSDLLPIDFFHQQTSRLWNCALNAVYKRGLDKMVQHSTSDHRSSFCKMSGPQSTEYALYMLHQLGSMALSSSKS